MPDESFEGAGQGGETGTEDDRVDRVLGAAAGHDRMRSDPRDRVGDHRDIRLAECGQIGIGEDGPLTTDHVVRGRPPPELRIADLPQQLEFAEHLEGVPEPFVDEPHQPGDLRLDPGHELDRGRAGADDRDSPAGQIVIVVPVQ